MSSSIIPPRPGRGALSNPEGRFESRRVTPVDDGWASDADANELPPLETTVTAEHAKRVISRNDSPDIGFEQSINPYRGCEHGCVYCYARPSHSYVNLSPGLDFETKLFYKAHAAQLLENELSKPGYVCKPINLGANTDPYQPVERKLRVTRSILEVLQRHRHPVTLVTKSSLIERDLDILVDLARDQLVSAFVSITTLDAALKRKLEPRAPSPAARLRAVRALHAAGVPVGVLVAPVIPAVTDHEIERILEACAEAGAQTAGYVLIRLPYELKTLFREWLDAHLPERAEHVMSLIRATRNGRENDPRFGSRMRGEGAYAELLGRRFATACRRLGLNGHRESGLSTQHFRPYLSAGDQLTLL
jgi:DNA repair photolyase